MVMGIIMKLLSHNDERTFMNMIVIFAIAQRPLMIFSSGLKNLQNESLQSLRVMVPEEEKGLELVKPSLKGYLARVSDEDLEGRVDSESVDLVFGGRYVITSRYLDLYGI